MAIRPSLPYQGIARRALKPSKPRPLFDDDFIFISSKNTITKKLDWNAPFTRNISMGCSVPYAPSYRTYKVIDRSLPSCILCKIKKTK